jgi:hypothetical protein
MRLSSIAVVLTLFMPSLSTAQSVQQQVKKLEIQWYDAIAKKDVAAIERLLADDFSETAPDGVVSTKADAIADLKSGEDAASSYANSDMRVRVYGDTAVVTYVDKETVKGRDVSHTSRWTDTWVKRGSSWQCVSSQGTTIAHP